jgi:hypothetical protein
LEIASELEELQAAEAVRQESRGNETNRKHHEGYDNDYIFMLDHAILTEVDLSGRQTMIMRGRSKWKMLGYGVQRLEI